MTKFIKKAVREARYILMDHTNDEFNERLFSLDITGKYDNIPMPFLYLPEYLNTTTLDVHWKSIIDELRAKHEFILLYHGRQEWHLDTCQNKNTHHLIQGFANFKKKHPEATSHLIMLEYGASTEHSKKLIAELGIKEDVIWLPLLKRKELMAIISLADVVIGELFRSWLTYGCVIEALVMQKPYIHHCKTELYKDHYEKLYPMYHAAQQI